jgi:Protein of unknown function (DUF2934)
MAYSTDQYGSIKKAAYELYLQKGRLDGDDLSDWLQAEKMIFEKSSPAAGEVLPRRKTVAPKSKITAKEKSK